MLAYLFSTCFDGDGQRHFMPPVYFLSSFKRIIIRTHVYETQGHMIAPSLLIPILNEGRSMFFFCCC